jgi:hypothetical protein
MKNASRNLRIFEAIARQHGDDALRRFLAREAYLLGPVKWGVK